MPRMRDQDIQFSLSLRVMFQLDYHRQVYER